MFTRHTLSTVAGKTALGTVLPLILVLGAFLAYSIGARRREAMALAERSHAHHADMLAEMLRESTRRANRHDLEGIVAAVRVAERYNEVIITDANGVVRHARSRELLGRKLDRQRAECRGCHGGAPGRAGRQPVTVRVAAERAGGSASLRTVAHLANEPDCHRCHGRQRKQLGAVVLEAPLYEVEAGIWRSVSEIVVAVVVLLLAAVAAVYASQYRLVVRPLGELTATARAIEGGERDARPSTVAGRRDEVGQLMGAFRRMVTRLEEARSDLETKVELRTAALREMGEQLKLLHTRLMHVERLTTMGELAATIAHEVRTPLTALSINVQLLGRALRHRAAGLAHKPGDDPPGDAHEEAGDAVATLAVLEREVERINEVIEEFMRFARWPAPRSAEVDLATLCTHALQLLDLEARRHGIEVCFVPPGAPAHVRGDEDRLRQVIINLVINAIQAMEQGGTLTVLIERVQDEVMLRVADTGPGFADDVAEDMFKPFVTTKATGTGLGLSIAKRIVEEHGGRIAARRGAQRGAIVEVWLPATAGVATQERDHDDEAAAARG